MKNSSTSKNKTLMSPSNDKIQIKIAESAFQMKPQPQPQQLPQQLQMRNKVNTLAKSIYSQSAATILKKDNIIFTKAQSFTQKNAAIVKKRSILVQSPLQQTQPQSATLKLIKTNSLSKVKMQRNLLSPSLTKTTTQQSKREANLFSPVAKKSVKSMVKTSERKTEDTSKKYNTFDSSNLMAKSMKGRDTFSCFLKDMKSPVPTVWTQSPSVKKMNSTQ